MHAPYAKRNVGILTYVNTGTPPGPSASLCKSPHTWVLQQKSLKSSTNNTETNQSVNWAPRDASDPECKVYVVKLGQVVCESRQQHRFSMFHDVVRTFFNLIKCHSPTMQLQMSFAIRFSGALIAILFTCGLLQVWREGSIKVGIWNRRDALQVKQVQERTSKQELNTPRWGSNTTIWASISNELCTYLVACALKIYCEYPLIKFRVVADIFQNYAKLILS